MRVVRIGFRTANAIISFVFRRRYRNATQSLEAGSRRRALLRRGRRDAPESRGARGRPQEAEGKPERRAGEEGRRGDPEEARRGSEKWPPRAEHPQLPDGAVPGKPAEPGRSRQGDRRDDEDAAA